MLDMYVFTNLTLKVKLKCRKQYVSKMYDGNSVISDQPLAVTSQFENNTTHTCVDISS